MADGKWCRRTMHLGDSILFSTTWRYSFCEVNRFEIKRIEIEICCNINIRINWERKEFKNIPFFTITFLIQFWMRSNLLRKSFLWSNCKYFANCEIRVCSCISVCMTKSAWRCVTWSLSMHLTLQIEHNHKFTESDNTFQFENLLKKKYLQLNYEKLNSFGIEFYFNFDFIASSRFWKWNWFRNSGQESSLLRFLHYFLHRFTILAGFLYPDPLLY